ncbi:MAG: ABC transporter substrate-binding protein [Rhizobiales bacterium]|nr:ABC transporter substrate-binding protein [Hyphomicrobiales bacterium]
MNAQTELHDNTGSCACFLSNLRRRRSRLFAKEGIKLELVATQGDGPDVDALISGTVQFTTSTPNRLLTAYLQGRPLKAVMSVMNRFTNYCYISKKSAEKVGFKPDQSIDEKIKRLKGLTIGGTRPGSTTFLLAQYYLKRAI